MATLTREDRRRGLQFAKSLSDLAAIAPDPYAKRRLNQTVNDLRNLCGLKTAEKKALVLDCIKKGCSTYLDLEVETGIAKSEINAVVQGLVRAGYVSLVKLAASTGGRPSMFIRIRRLDPLKLNGMETADQR